MGVWSDATDKWDEACDFLILPSDEGYAGVYHEYGLGDWLGETGFYRTDHRALLAPDESKTWEQLYVWADRSYTEPSMSLSMLSSNAYPPPPDRDYLLELVSVPDGITGAPETGTVWELPLGGELFVLELPTYCTGNGLEGYEFAFTMTAVPEPATFGLVAVGIVSLLSRPRKKQ